MRSVHLAVGAAHREIAAGAGDSGRRGALEDPGPHLLGDPAHAQHQGHRVHQPAAPDAQPGKEGAGVDIGADLLAVEELDVLTVAEVARHGVAQRLDLVRGPGQGRLADHPQIRVDVVALQEFCDLCDILPAKPLEFGEFIRPHRLTVGDAVGERLRDESAVAARGRRTHPRLFEDDDPAAGMLGECLDRRPQAGVPAADDDEIGAHPSAQRFGLWAGVHTLPPHGTRLGVAQLVLQVVAGCHGGAPSWFNVGMPSGSDG